MFIGVNDFEVGDFFANLGIFTWSGQSLRNQVLSSLTWYIDVVIFIEFFI